MRNFNIPIFVPHKGCPFDCVFCNQKRITGTTREIDEKDVREIIEKHLQTLPKNDRYIEAAFFGGSFTGIDMDIQKKLLSVAYEYVKNGSIDGIRLSTRPDYITKEILDQLAKYHVTTIELGVQSLDEDVLKASNRGHTQKQVIDAVALIREYPFTLGLQMMTGLPCDTFEKSIQTCQKIISLKPDIVRIYPTLVIKDTYLETLYQNGKYKPQTVDEAVALCKELLLMFDKANIDVIRMSLATTDEISPDGSVVAGPFHFAFRELVESAIYYDKICDLIKGKHGRVCIKVNTKEVSKAIGNKKNNILKIKDKMNIDLKVCGVENLEKGQIIIG